MLQEREFEPLGSERSQKVDVRVIAATNRDLRQMVAEGRFQEDLFYRLNVIPIQIPPLRERREDIAVLAEHFVGKHAQRSGRPARQLHESALAVLQRYDWPGNVRELENTIERAVVLSREPGDPRRRHLGALRRHAAPRRACRRCACTRTSSGSSARRSAARSRPPAASRRTPPRLMGISQRALSYYLAKHRLSDPQP